MTPNVSAVEKISEKREGLSPLQKAALALRNAEKRIRALEHAKTEPIAIVGMSCRFPGAPSVEDYYQLLCDGTDAITEAPKERWDLDELYDTNPNAAGKINTRYGGFISDVDKFDARFFGLSPLEARLMDPQHRLSLELVWHALEDSGLRPSGLRGSRTGVFVGVTQNDYGVAQFAGPRNEIRAFSGTGNGFCFTAGRIAFQFGFNGPAVAVDTACSSSLVALHQACGALRARECDLAVVIGTQLNLTPPMQIFLSRTQSFSPTGRCRAFDADSDGFVLGEGVGVLVLRRESDDSIGGSPPRAMVLNCGVNHDGPASGLTVPNQKAQEDLIRGLLERSQVSPNMIGYIETHGTGTPLGDPIEIGALRNVFASRDIDRPLLIGSVKSNIGHLSAAAGMASIIKSVLMLETDQVFPQIHFRRPNSKIPWDGFNVEVPTSIAKFSSGGKTPVVGVSSFGLSGTNAHALFKRATATASCSKDLTQNQPAFLAISARDPRAFGLLVDKHSELINAIDDGDPFLRYCETNNLARDHLEIRRLIMAVDKSGALVQLEKCATWGLTPECVAPRKPKSTAFVLTGEPEFSQHLYQYHSQYRDSWNQCCEAIGFDASEAVGDPKTYLGRQADLVSWYALAALWKSWGINPDLCVASAPARAIASVILESLPLNEIVRLHGKVSNNQTPDALIDSELVLAWEQYCPEPSQLNTRGLTLAEQLKSQGVENVVMLSGDGELSEYFENINVISAPSGPDPWVSLSTSLTNLYEKGFELSWSKIQESNPSRVRLPLYPFSRESYWVDLNQLSEKRSRTPQDSDRSVARNLDVKHIFSEQWADLTEKTLSLAQSQLGDYAKTRLKNEEVNEYPSEIACGDWRLRVVTAPDHNLLAKKIANPPENSSRPVLVPAEAEGSGTSFGDTLGTVLVWNHEKSHTPRAKVEDRKPAPRVLNLKPRASLTMMLAGVGDQHLNMGSDLYRSQTDFRRAFDLCAEHLQSLLARDIRQDLFREEVKGSTSNSSSAPDFRAMLRRGSSESTRPEVEGLEATEIVQPLMFAFVYSLATMWQQVGLKPDALIGYSVGEYVAACLAGVFSLPDALAIVATRAKLIAEMPRGGLMAVPLSEKDCQSLLGDSVYVAITSSPKQTILAGTPTSLGEVQLSLKAKGIVARALPGSHAYHSPMLSPVSERLERHLNLVKLKKPSVPIISNLTGKPLRESEATRPDYWSKHTCSTVRFHEGLSFLLQSGDMDLLEVGPGRSLGSFAMQNPLYNKTGIHNMLSTISGKWENLSDERVFLDSRGVLHLLGHNSVPEGVRP